MPAHSRRRVPPSATLGALTAFWLSACGHATDPSGQAGPPGPPTQFVVVSAAPAEAAAGEPLAQPLVVRVLDAQDRGVPGIAVSWEWTGKGQAQGLVAPASARTDARGEVRATWTLAPALGVQQARAVAVAEVVIGDLTVRVTAVPGAAARASFDTVASRVQPVRVSLSVAAGDTVRLDAVTRDRVGHVAPGAVAFAGTDPSVATVDDQGRLIGHAAGTTWAVARLAGAPAGAPLDSLRVRVFAPLQATQVAVGGGFTCAIDAGGRLLCWGVNRVPGASADPGARYASVPTPVRPDLTFRTVVASDTHACALEQQTGRAWCWGRGESGELGDGSSTTSAAPVAVAGGLTFTRLAVTSSRSCGVTDAGRVYCWGAPVVYDHTANVATPVAVPTPFTATDVTVALAHACALDGDGAAWCWGTRSVGALGRGPVSDAEAAVPGRVLGGLTFSKIAAGYYQTCGVTTAGQGYCWGRGTSWLAASAVPAPAFPGATLRDVTVDGHSASSATPEGLGACALTTDGRLLCAGTLTGNGTATSATAAAPAVAQVAGVTALPAGSGVLKYHRCVVAAGVVRCWGYNPYGALGRLLPGEGVPTGSSLDPASVSGWGVTYAPLAVQAP